MFKKSLILASIIILQGCTGDYTVYEPVSPPLEGLQDTSTFFDSGWELNDAITANAVNNLMSEL